MGGHVRLGGGWGEVGPQGVVGRWPHHRIQPGEPVWRGQDQSQGGTAQGLRTEEQHAARSLQHAAALAVAPSAQPASFAGTSLVRGGEAGRGTEGLRPRSQAARVSSVRQVMLGQQEPGSLDPWYGVGRGVASRSDRGQTGSRFCHAWGVVARQRLAWQPQFCRCRPTRLRAGPNFDTVRALLQAAFAQLLVRLHLEMRQPYAPGT